MQDKVIVRFPQANAHILSAQDELREMTLAAIEMRMWGVDRETISSDLEEYAPAFNDGSKGWQRYFTEIKEEILNTVFNQLPKSETERGLLTERFTGDGNCEFKVDVIDNDSMVLYYE